MKKFAWILYGPICAVLSACDLQPKIVSLPDSVGDFISARYPALLADPETQPEIYNSAAADYGVYASPQLYGTPADDYVVYASVADYRPPAATSDTKTDTAATAVATTDGASRADDYLVVPMYGGGAHSDATDEITVGPGDTLYSLARRYGMTSGELARINAMSESDVLAVGRRLRVRNGTAADNVMPPRRADATPTVAVNGGTSTAPDTTKTNTATTRVPLQDITVAPGDTLYSLSRKYSVPVNDLAVMNNLSAPFTLGVGQKLRVPNLSSVPAMEPGKKTAAAGTAKPATNTNKKPVTTPATVSPQHSPTASAQPVATPPKKISSDPSKKLPAIGARSSSKFSWPVRGKILSNYGAKPNGLFNDGINIGAARGTRVSAAENGVVAYAGNEVKGMGNLVIIQHSGGWMTVYAHMDSMNVRRGMRVNVGTAIGAVGATGKVDTPQLHFEIRKGTRAYNPSQYLKK